VKSGWASVAHLCGPVESPRVVDSRRVDLNDPANPAIPESRQPYHAGFTTARPAWLVLAGRRGRAAPIMGR
jgi:hypothetical protein